MRRPLIRLLIFILVLCSTARADKPEIKIVYPKMNSVIGAADSTFILGSVTPGSKLTINGIKAPVHKDGGFIAFLPIHSGNFEFQINARLGGDVADVSWPVIVPSPQKSLAYDKLRIEEINDSLTNLGLPSGDRLIVEFKGTPGCVAYFSIPGVADSIPMAELTPRSQAFWSEAIYGARAIPETFKVRGIYQGFFDIGKDKTRDSTRICYHLKGPDINYLRQRLAENPAELDHQDFISLTKLNRKQITDSSKYFVSINPALYPRLVEFTDSVQVIRVGPQKGYLSIYQPKGVIAEAVGYNGEWLKLRLSETQVGWVKSSSVKFLDIGLARPISNIKSIRTFSYPESLVVEVPMGTMHPFRVDEEDPTTALIDIFGAVSETDRIRYDFTDDYLEIATWSQIEPDLYRLKLKFKHAIWGYDVYYNGPILKYKLIKPPPDLANLRNKIIVVDPGHSLDPGAIGPTGLRESEANLAIAKVVRLELEKKGATVFLTRNDMYRPSP